MTDLDLTRYAFDGVQLDQRSVQYRYPIITTMYPRWAYITAVVVGELWGGVLPTDDDLRVIASFHDEYIRYWYGDPERGWIAGQRQTHPAFDVDGGANGRYLIKYDHGGWGLKQRSWRHEARPEPREDPMSLVELMDRHHTIGNDSQPMGHWSQWKAACPEVFGTESVR